LGIFDSLKKLVFFLVFIIVLSIITLALFDLFVAAPINLPLFIRQVFSIIIIFAFGLTAIIVVSRRIKPLITPRIGNHAATIIQFAMLAIAVLAIIFGVLNSVGVSPQTLLTSAGIISLTVGLVISTFVGSTLSGALVFATYKFEVGDDVMVNNVPGKVTEMTMLITRIQTDVGQISIPNSAISSGVVIITAVRKFEEPLKGGRLHYAVGDRVVTSYMNEQGTVKELTPLQTIVQLDSGKEITFLNNSVLSGTVPIAKITQTPKQAEEKTVQ